MYKIIFITSFIIISILVFILNCSSFGEDPSGKHLEFIKKSANFKEDRNEFVNRRADILKEMNDRSRSFSTIGKYLFGGGEFRKPKSKLPEIKPDIEEFLKKSDSIKFIWFGHSTFVVNFEGNIILFDPVFSGSAAPFSFMVKRFQDAIIKLEELPAIDYILISHDHYDHLDKDTIDFFKTKNTKFITPLGVTSHLKSWGINENRLTELDWWQSTKVGDLEIICTPAQHFSGRKGFGGNKTLWGSYAIIGKKQRFYFSGDSGYDTHFKTIGNKFGPFDLTFIENGQYNELWREVHVLPEETAQAYFDLKSKALVPVHWGMFDLSLHNWYEPIEKIEQEAISKNINLYTPKFGQLVITNETNIFDKWWKKYITNSP